MQEGEPHHMGYGIYGLELLLLEMTTSVCGHQLMHETTLRYAASCEVG
jgi:hypothetical protein